MIKKKKPLQKVGIEGTYLNLMKAMYDKSTANIILSGEKQNIPSKIRNRGGCPLSRILLSKGLEAPAMAICKEKEIKGFQIRQEVKLSLFADDTILYIDNIKDVIKKTTRAYQ